MSKKPVMRHILVMEAAENDSEADQMEEMSEVEDAEEEQTMEEEVTVTVEGTGGDNTNKVMLMCRSQ